jgi:hypothetical protein
MSHPIVWDPWLVPLSLPAEEAGGWRGRPAHCLVLRGERAAARPRWCVLYPPRSQPPAAAATALLPFPPSHSSEARGASGVAPALCRCRSVVLARLPPALYTRQCLRRPALPSLSPGFLGLSLPAATGRATPISSVSFVSSDMASGEVAVAVPGRKPLPAGEYRNGRSPLSSRAACPHVPGALRAIERGRPVAERARLRGVAAGCRGRRCRGVGNGGSGCQRLVPMLSQAYARRARRSARFPLRGAACDAISTARAGELAGLIHHKDRRYPGGEGVQRIVASREDE